MFTQYKNLPDTSRIWIYQSDREFTEKEVDFISIQAEEFINTWTRHGDYLKGSFILKYNQFLILAVDEGFNNVSGCSIDSSVRFIKEIEEKLDVDLTDKMNVTFKDGDNINVVKLPQFQEFTKAKKIIASTIVFNNMVGDKAAFEKNWEVTAAQSWHKRFLA